ncbi:MAG: 16S rRNA (guanine(527)-N(7))-methyltransferase RsmG [Isosphaeraceae bacterium]
MKPGLESLESLLRACGIALKPDQYRALWDYHRLLRGANAELNLTRIHNFENMVLKHYADSLLVLKYEGLPSPLIDMGSGPGLPGIPLRIARPDVRMILAEPRGVRAEFLEGVVNELKLDGCEVYAGKIGPRFDRPVAGVITRAVATIPETLEKVANCIQPGGRMLFMKGPDCDDEIADAKSSSPGFRFRADHAYSIPGTTHQRRLVVYERLESPSMAVPAGFSGEIREVSSAANPTFKHLRDLLQGKGIRKHGQALIAGARVVDEVRRLFPGRVLGWVAPPGGERPPADSPFPWIRLADPLFREIDVSGTHAPILWVETPPIEAWDDSAEWPDGCTLFLPFQDPENVGAAIRSAAAFGVGRVVLLKEAAHPFHPKAARAAGTSLFQVRLESGPSIRDLAIAGAPWLALDAGGEPLASSPFPERFGLIVGVEGPGLPESLRGGNCRRIPIAEGVESLNAAASLAIALYEWRRNGPMQSDAKDAGQGDSGSSDRIQENTGP